jgi:hypothetical protein
MLEFTVRYSKYPIQTPHWSRILKVKIPAVMPDNVVARSENRCTFKFDPASGFEEE